MSILYLKFKSVNSDIIYNTFDKLSENSIIQENDAGGFQTIKRVQ